MTVDDRRLQLDRILDEYEKQLGVPVLTGEDEVTTEARRLLDLPPAQLKKMTALECGYAAYTLGQYAHRVQQAVNREQGRATWGNRSIDRVIASKVNGYRGYSFQERRLQAINDDEAAKKLDEIVLHAQLRIDRLSYLSGKANDLTKTLLSIKNSKQGNHGE